jgi:peptidoglycan/xylan/chitin deacetylase (PgdA/CDA1 family)
MAYIEKVFLKGVAGISWIVESIGLYELLRTLNKQKVIILMYHGVTANHDPVANFDGKHVETAKFEKQLQYILKHNSIISIDDFLAWKTGEKSLQKNSVILTFDDCYQNCYTQLFPLLKKYHVPVTLFLPTVFIGKNEPAWYDAVAYCIAYTKEREIIINEKKYPMSTEKQRIAALVELKRRILDFPELRATLLREITSVTKIDPAQCHEEDFSFCSWEQCQKMKESGFVTFGSHSVTHRLMTGLSEKEIGREIRESKRVIEAKLHLNCDTFAYPFGSNNERTKEAIEKARYRCGLSTTYGKNTQTTDVRALKRIVVNNLYDSSIFSLSLFINFPSFHHWLLERYSNLKFLFNTQR